MRNKRVQIKVFKSVIMLTAGIMITSETEDTLKEVFRELNNKAGTIGEGS